MSAYLSVRPVNFGSLFIHSDCSVLTRYQFNFVLKKCFVLLRLNHLHFTAHSFRIGAATEAARLGLDNSVIKRLGRWESDRFNIYIRPDLVVS